MLIVIESKLTNCPSSNKSLPSNDTIFSAKVKKKKNRRGEFFFILDIDEKVFVNIYIK